MNVEILERVIRQLMRKKNTPGLALSIVKDNQLLYSKGFGFRDLKQHQPMSSDTLIGIGSVTKSFVAFAIVKLEEMGKLSLEDSAADYLAVDLFSSRPEIKIKHLLSHSTGIPASDAGQSVFAFAFNDFNQVFPVAKREEFFAHLNDAADFIIAEPGEQFFYNNDMYTCLGFIIEKVTGTSFEQFIQEAILSPLQMSRAVLTQQAFDADPENNKMTGYRYEKRGDKKHYQSSDIPIGGYVQAPGGIYASMNEMIHYARCLLNNGEFDGQQILSSDSVAKLFSPHISTPYGFSQDPQYCLGWSRDEKTTNIPYTVIHHGGAMLTSSSNVVLIPELNLGIAVAENASTGICSLITDTVIATLLGNDPYQVVEGLNITAVIEDITGLYQSPHDMYSFHVLYDNNVLQVKAGIDDGTIEFPLVLNNLNALEFARYSLREDNKNKVQFFRNDSTGKVEFVSYDRYLYRRV